jgi:hypothetical protein
VTNEPAEGALDPPPTRQHFEANGGTGTFDDLDRQFRAQPFNPLGERISREATLHPQQAEPGQLAQHRAQDRFCPSRSGVLAVVTANPSTSPRVSTSKCRLRPLIRLAAS